MTFTSFNHLDKEEAGKLLSTCCGSAKWVELVMDKFPFHNEEDLISTVTHSWYNECFEQDWLQAFSQHPKIGDIKSLEEKFASTKHLAGNEQAGMEVALTELVENLSNANNQYEDKFGFIFIVCATGKTAREMFRLLSDRMNNNREEELHIAMGEQQKITILRIKKAIEEANWLVLKGSQLTTHVLDTSLGKPGQDITIRLKFFRYGSWQIIAQGITNADGRIADLLPPGRNLQPGNYKIIFETADYFTSQNIKGFYPEVEIQFTVFDDAHYHVPLLINPFGYSTYRGS